MTLFLIGFVYLFVSLESHFEAHPGLTHPVFTWVLGIRSQLFLQCLQELSPRSHLSTQYPPLLPISSGSSQTHCVAVDDLELLSLDSTGVGGL